MFDRTSNTISYNPQYAGWSSMAAKTAAEHKARHFSSGDQRHVAFHELAHADDFDRGVLRKPGARAFKTQRDAVVARRVSIRAAENVNEFMAEVRAGLMAGRRFDDQIMRMYQRLRK